MNAFARRIKAQGSERFLKIGSRVFQMDAMAGGRGREVSEVLSCRDGCASYFPGYVRGAKHYGFPMLNSAALDRRFAFDAKDPYRRRKLIERAYESLRTASEIYPAPQLDPVERQEVRRAA